MTLIKKDLSSVLRRNLIFVHGKGGVGKTAVSQALALALSKSGAKTLWIALEDPTRPPGELKQITPTLWHLNCDFLFSFEEYAGMKIGATRLAKLFLHNKLIRYLAKAAPGVHELVLLGKIWHERNHYAHVIVDLPSTGYGLAMFQSTDNFSKLFQGGPLHRDAEDMNKTFHDASSTGHLIISLPEEMPLRESLELNEFLSEMFPQNPAAFIANRLFPQVIDPRITPNSLGDPDLWQSPFATSEEDYALKRYWLETFNLRLWRDAEIPFGQLDYIPPPPSDENPLLVERLAEDLQRKGYL